MISSVDILDKGMAALVSALGVVEAEYFITYIKQDKFDYTKWRKTQFEDMSIEEISDAASKYVAEHPFKGKATRI